MSHYKDQREREQSDHEPVCNICSDGKAELTNTNPYGWICDDCLAQYELLDIMMAGKTNEQ